MNKTPKGSLLHNSLIKPEAVYLVAPPLDLLGILGVEAGLTKDDVKDSQLKKVVD